MFFSLHKKKSQDSPGTSTNPSATSSFLLHHLWHVACFLKVASWSNMAAGVLAILSVFQVEGRKEEVARTENAFLTENVLFRMTIKPLHLWSKNFTTAYNSIVPSILCALVIYFISLHSKIHNILLVLLLITLWRNLEGKRLVTFSHISSWPVHFIPWQISLLPGIISH